MQAPAASATKQVVSVSSAQGLRMNGCSLLRSTAAALAAAANGTTPNATAATPAALLGLILAPLLAQAPASLSTPSISSSSSSDLSSLSSCSSMSVSSSSLALDLAMGPSTAASAAAAAAMLPSLQGGIRYAADADSLAVIACGSAEVMAAANASAALGGVEQAGAGLWWSDEDSFLRE
ncbi:hypothetical protein DUNSADRAFT_4769 [Dunaliella salina]|uniref:Uncharacterized protein n=1 Tax=Dunaliella salina TaxID=3046 RepID=A0ABQ7GRC7_DUNSA|nr:hypothetical protein DUNSADRAFT_4769 [Dunaliella salina]|eukprot:KAF5837149.1 hypothetical protein DUNSADRAFT_4769 [Dunaliella salina]